MILNAVVVLCQSDKIGEMMGLQVKGVFCCLRAK